MKKNFIFNHLFLKLRLFSFDAPDRFLLKSLYEKLIAGNFSYFNNDDYDDTYQFSFPDNHDKWEISLQKIVCNNLILFEDKKITAFFKFHANQVYSNIILPKLRKEYLNNLITTDIDHFLSSQPLFKPVTPSQQLMKIASPDEVKLFQLFVGVVCNQIPALNNFHFTSSKKKSFLDFIRLKDQSHQVWRCINALDDCGIYIDGFAVTNDKKLISLMLKETHYYRNNNKQAEYKKNRQFLLSNKDFKNKLNNFSNGFCFKQNKTI